MKYKMGILIVHGMGNQAPDFADAAIDGLNKKIKATGADPGGVCWRPAYWSDVLQYKEDKLWRDLSLSNKLKWPGFRKFVISAFGDAIAYQRVKKDEDIYFKIHKKIHEHLVRLREEIKEANQDAGDVPLVVIAHSLGCYIISNYIWDRQKDYETETFGGNDFLEMKTLSGIITYGCNIPLFSLAYDPVEAVAFPPEGLKNYFPPETGEDDIKNAAKWFNFYDPDDVLGYPLKPLSASYDKSVSADLPINAGGLLTSWNPLSHTEYDADNNFLKPSAAMIAGILSLLG